METGKLLHYDTMKISLQTVIDNTNTKDSADKFRLIDIMRILDLSAELVTCDAYEGNEERITELIYEILS